MLEIVDSWQRQFSGFGRVALLLSESKLLAKSSCRTTAVGFLDVGATGSEAVPTRRLGHERGQRTQRMARVVEAAAAAVGAEEEVAAGDKIGRLLESLVAGEVVEEQVWEEQEV